MPAVPLPAAFLATADETEHQFYEALAHADLAALMACWADDEEVSCIHPGGPCFMGVEAIRAAFESIFAHGAIDAHPEAVRRFHSEGVSVHSVMQRVRQTTDQGSQTVWIMATNVYVKTAQGWRLVAHHASLGDAGHQAEAYPDNSTLH
jgi:ketosteroid isomerase-like protein